jgi:glycosyltransferase involved in cell wall biosynthesis
MEGAKPTVSIVITSYTMERFDDLIELLESLHAQTYRNFETILVAERSTELYDKLGAYVEEKGYQNCKVLFNAGPWGLSPARNMGIKEAKGDIIAFIDDDALAFPDWAEEMVKTYKDDSIIGVTGPAFPLWEDESMNWLPEEFYWIIGCTAWFDCNEMREVRNAWGNNMSFKKEGIDSGGLFSNRLGANGGGGGLGKQEFACEDTELSIRVRKKTGGCILYNPNVSIKHRVYRYRLNWRFIARRAYSEGYTKGMFKRLYRNKGGGSNVLATEYTLLRRILFKLSPDILRGFFRHPVVSWRRLRVTITVLFCVAFGYLWGTFHPRRENLG